MADPTYYAWSPILGGSADKPVSIKAGDTVTADKLGVSKEAFAELVAGGSVRTTKYPDIPDGYQDSPVNFMREKAAEMAGENEEAMLALAASNLEPGTPQASPARSIKAAGAP